jgi:hypothetical protein
MRLILVVWVVAAAAASAPGLLNHHPDRLPIFKVNNSHYAVDIQQTTRFQQPVEAEFRRLSESRRLSVPFCGKSSCGSCYGSEWSGMNPIGDVSYNQPRKTLD